MNVPFSDLRMEYQKYQHEYEDAVMRVLKSGWYILGKEVEAFETEFSRYVGRKYCVGVNSGLDALTLAIRAYGIGRGDEVIVPSNTYIATVLAITANGAIPVFCEPDEMYGLDPIRLEKCVTSKTKAIMVVHLYGQAADMERICSISKMHDLILLEDCAQSHGATFQNHMTGSFGEIGCFSFYPTKNLGAFGDGGAIVTDNVDVFEKVRTLRNYGSKVKYYNKFEGINSRLDELQAALLRVKLRHLPELLAERQVMAMYYLTKIKNSLIRLPKIREGAKHTYHQFVIQTDNRDGLQIYLKKNGIQTAIHYPIPPHLAECYKRLNYKTGDFPIAEMMSKDMLSLPMYNGITKKQLAYVTDCINRYTEEIA